MVVFKFICDYYEGDYIIFLIIDLYVVFVEVFFYFDEVWFGGCLGSLLGVLLFVV